MFCLQTPWVLFAGHRPGLVDSDWGKSCLGVDPAGDDRSWTCGPKKVNSDEGNEGEDVRDASDVGVALELGVLGNLPEHHRGRGEVRAVRVHLFRDKKEGDGRRATRETFLVRRRERGFASRRVASVVFFASRY